MGTVSSYATTEGKRYRVRYRKPDNAQTDKRGFKTKREAELFLSSVEVAKARGEFIDGTAARAQIGVLGPVWLKHQGHLKPSSLLPLEVAWRLYVEPRWSTVPVADVRHSDVQSWVMDMSAKRGATTVIRAYGVLASIMDGAVKDRRILSNSARGVNLPRKVTKPHAYLTPQQVSDLSVAAGDHGTLLLVLAYTGLRWGEAVALRVKDLDMLRRRANVTTNAVEVNNRIEVGTPKSHKRRSVPFPATLAPALAKACEGKAREDLVFAGASGSYLRRAKTDAGWFGVAVKRAGLPRMTLHDLRHTAASLAVSSGANVKAVQRMLGHASASMTLDVYADLFEDDLDEVAGRLDHLLISTDVGRMWARSGNSVNLN
ncbi:site-specific integrase [Naasia lichenicola]|uniref:Site-specific integrase n=1 Tax=Naasia lichenicola TaxID=2565933 RepID=A0A4S4FGP5_9MICO|nr:site-specific integrase [Naasia lichenicola]THG29281.1 site-specific integrase [Naasia lichenicola]